VSPRHWRERIGDRNRLAVCGRAPGVHPAGDGRAGLFHTTVRCIVADALAQCLGDTAVPPITPRCGLRAGASRGANIHGAAQEFLKLRLEAAEAKERDRAVELGEEIHVAIGAASPRGE